MHPVLRREPTFSYAPNAAPAATLAPVPEETYAPTRVAPPPAPIKSGKRVTREAQPSLLDALRFMLPALTLLAEAKRPPTKISSEALEQNARLLPGVLGDPEANLALARALTDPGIGLRATQ